jgi:hypothetical protein
MSSVINAIFKSRDRKTIDWRAAGVTATNLVAAATAPVTGTNLLNDNTGTAVAITAATSCQAPRELRRMTSPWLANLLSAIRWL